MQICTLDVPNLDVSPFTCRQAQHRFDGGDASRWAGHSLLRYVLLALTIAHNPRFNPPVALLVYEADGINALSLHVPGYLPPLNEFQNVALLELKQLLP